MSKLVQVAPTQSAADALQAAEKLHARAVACRKRVVRTICLGFFGLVFYAAFAWVTLPHRLYREAGYTYDSSAGLFITTSACDVIFVPSATNGSCVMCTFSTDALSSSDAPFEHNVSLPLDNATHTVRVFKATEVRARAVPSVATRARAAALLADAAEASSASLLLSPISTKGRRRRTTWRTT